MTHDELISLLRQSGPGRPTGTLACPDDHEIAAYVDGIPDESTRETLEQHLADCERCLNLVGILSRARDATAAPVAEALVTRARLATRPRRKNWTGLLAGLAAAAALVLGVAVLLDPAQQQVAIDPDEPRATRSSPSSPALHVIAPAPGAIIDAGRLSIRWAPVPGSRYYVVRIVTDSGELVAEHRVTGTEWSPGNEVKLESSREYFVRVDAYPADMKSLSSSHVPFRIVNRP